MNFLSFIIDEIAETINYLKTRKDVSKVFVYKDDRWRLSRWDILKKGQVVRFMCPVDWPNHSYTGRVYKLGSHSFCKNGTWGVGVEKCFPPMEK